MNSFDGVHPTMREALALHDIGRAIGFLPDHLYLDFRPKLRLVAVAFKREREAAILAGPWTGDESSVRAAWAAAVSAWNESPHADRAELVNATKARRGAVKVIAELVALGFNLRRGGDA